VPLIPFAALAFWPVYSAISRRASNRRHIRVVLFVPFLIQAAFSVLVGRTWFKSDVGRFDDGMSGLVVIGALTIVCSMFVVVASEVVLFVTRRRRGTQSA
jgi:hypothetical protein